MARAFQCTGCGFEEEQEPHDGGNKCPKCDSDMTEMGPM